MKNILWLVLILIMAFHDHVTAGCLVCFQALDSLWLNEKFDDLYKKYDQLCKAINYDLPYIEGSVNLEDKNER